MFPTEAGSETGKGCARVLPLDGLPNAEGDEVVGKQLANRRCCLAAVLAEIGGALFAEGLNALCGVGRGGDVVGEGHDLLGYAVAQR